MKVLLLMVFLSILGMVSISHANGECKDWNGDCNRCIDGKCMYFINHEHNDKGVCISKDRISDIGGILKKDKEYERSENCTQTPNSSNAASKTNMPQSKSFNGGVFFGGIVCAIALLLVFAFGWNKYLSMRNGTQVKYGLLSQKQANPNTK